MKKPFLLVCQDSNAMHTRFNLFDSHRANCGAITVLTAEVEWFIATQWNGDVDWNGKYTPNPTTP